MTFKRWKVNFNLVTDTQTHRHSHLWTSRAAPSQLKTDTNKLLNFFNQSFSQLKVSSIGRSHWWKLQYILCWAAHKTLRSACFMNVSYLTFLSKCAQYNTNAGYCVFYNWCETNPPVGTINVWMLKDFTFFQDKWYC